MPKYRKKPIVVEATRWFKNGDHPEDDIGTAISTSGKPFNTEGKIVRYYRDPDLAGNKKCKNCKIVMHNHGWIDTVQGGHIVCPGDWVITDDRVKHGEHGHYYPCKAGVFEQTYEIVEE